MSIATVVTMGFGSFGSVNKLPTLGYSAGAPETPTAISTDAIVAMYTFPRALGDDIVYQEDDGTLKVGRGYNPPAALTPPTTLVVGLYTYADNDGEEIIRQLGSGVVQVSRGLSG